MTSLRCGLIGYGAWGSHHARALAAVEGAELTAVCARSPASRQQAASEHPRAKLYGDYAEMLSQEPLDAVSVVLPSDQHYAAAKSVLQADRHLLLEKPMTLSVAECTALIELARSRGKLLAVGHELRVSSLWGRVKRLVDEGAIGEPLYALVELWRRPYRQGAGGWRYDPARVGDWTLEEPIHFFDLARWYFARCGEPNSVFAQASGQRKEPGLHDNFSASLTFPQGRYAVITQSLSGWEHHQQVKLTGTNGALWAKWSGATDRTFEPAFSLQLRQDDRVEEVSIGKASGEVYELVEQAAAFVRAIREGTQLPCTGEDGRWSVAMCLKAAESIDLGAPVPLAPFTDRWART